MTSKSTFGILVAKLKYHNFHKNTIGDGSSQVVDVHVSEVCLIMCRIILVAGCTILQIIVQPITSINSFIYSLHDEDALVCLGAFNAQLRLNEPMYLLKYG